MVTPTGNGDGVPDHRPGPAAATRHHLGRRRTAVVHRVRREPDRRGDDDGRCHRVSDPDGSRVGRSRSPREPDGKVWFTENAAAANTVARVTTERHDHGVPDPVGGPDRWASHRAGRDARRRRDELDDGRDVATTAGTITETRFRKGRRPGASRRVPTETCGSPRRIANAIGKMSPAGTLLAEYPVPTPEAGLELIVAAGREPLVRREGRQQGSEDHDFRDGDRVSGPDRRIGNATRHHAGSRWQRVVHGVRGGCHRAGDHLRGR